MTTRDSTGAKFSQTDDLDATEYRSVSPLAILALILGIASCLVFWGRVMWVVPGVGVLVSLIALRTIAANCETKIGRKAALVGLALSLFFAAAAPARLVSHDLWLRAEAVPFAQQWFDFLLKNEPHKARQLEVAYANRQPLDESLWDYYRHTPEARRPLESFVDDRLVRTLLALGKKARVNYWATEEYWVYSDEEQIVQIFSVTYEEDGQDKTFFVRIGLERTRHPETGQGHWRVHSHEGGVRPFEPYES